MIAARLTTAMMEIQKAKQATSPSRIPSLTCVIDQNATPDVARQITHKAAGKTRCFLTDHTQAAVSRASWSSTQMPFRSSKSPVESIAAPRATRASGQIAAEKA